MIWLAAAVAWLACSACAGLALGAFIRAGKGTGDD